MGVEKISYRGVYFIYMSGYILKKIAIIFIPELTREDFGFILALKTGLALLDPVLKFQGLVIPSCG